MDQAFIIVQEKNNIIKRNMIWIN